jgi:hypothetical protein
MRHIMRAHELPRYDIRNSGARNIVPKLSFAQSSSAIGRAPASAVQ